MLEEYSVHHVDGPRKAAVAFSKKNIANEGAY